LNHIQAAETKEKEKKINNSRGKEKSHLRKQ
jgi:hypothetical protein